MDLWIEECIMEMGATIDMMDEWVEEYCMDMDATMDAMIGDDGLKSTACMYVDGCYDACHDRR